MRIRDFVDLHFRHFNARETREAAKGWIRHLEKGGKMLLTLGGAMSTAELGISLARMIRQRKIHGICCTGANLEEDLFNLVAHNDYRVVPHWRELTPELERELYEEGMNRVTDTCIPETVMRHIEKRILKLWSEAGRKGERHSHWHYVRTVAGDETLRPHFQIPAEHSWVLAAHEADIPVLVPGWEDSTLGNMFSANVMMGNVASHQVVRNGSEQMQELAEWYLRESEEGVSMGFFQIAGGIAGDFPICVVPMLHQDMKRECPSWGYFAQISDSTTSYGSYSGANPGEKITWGKLDVGTPRFAINSDASIVAPLIFAYVLGE